MKKSSIIVGVMLLHVFLSGCGAQGESIEVSASEEAEVELIEIPIEAEETQEITEGTVKIGCMGNPSEELLIEAGKLMLEEGWGLEIVQYQDSLEMDKAVLDGELDGHVFAHAPYIESYNLVNQANLTSAGVLWYEVYGIYGGLKQDLTSLKRGATIAIPDSGVNQARALLFLQDLEYITVKEGMGPSTNLEDVLENPKELNLVGISNEEFLEARNSYDYLLCGGNTALVCGYNTVKEPLKKETIKNDSVQLLGTHLVTNPSGVNGKGIRALQDAFQSEKMQAYLEYMMQNTIATK